MLTMAQCTLTADEQTTLSVRTAYLGDSEVFHMSFIIKMFATKMDQVKSVPTMDADHSHPKIPKRRVALLRGRSVGSAGQWVWR